jgi:hypothetical protein
MHNERIYLLNPVFHWLDGLIHDEGDYLYLMRVHVSLPLITWILSGGLRRSQAGRRTAAVAVAARKSAR